MLGTTKVNTVWNMLQKAYHIHATQLNGNYFCYSRLEIIGFERLVRLEWNCYSHLSSHITGTYARLQTIHILRVWLNLSTSRNVNRK